MIMKSHENMYGRYLVKKRYGKISILNLIEDLIKNI
jgi:hypothetical protein